MTAEQQTITDFLAPYFGPTSEIFPMPVTEQSIADAVLAGIARDFAGKRYILGLALDFALLAQRLSLVDQEAKAFRPALTTDALFGRYARVTEKSGRLANTLTVKYENATEGIRRIEEQVVKLFHALGRSGYPSAYVYNTGQWHKYPELLLSCFQLSENGRFHLCRSLIEFGLDALAANTFFGRETERPRLFAAIIGEYDRTARRAENGGLIYQAIAYGFMKADRGHLDLIADKVRTGSARQRRFGDIDGYYGLDLEASVEVKDLAVTSENLDRQFGPFVSEAVGSHISGLALAVSFAEEVRQKLLAYGITPLSQDDLLWIVRGWDWQKQDRAVQGVLHYLAHIEQNPEAVGRLLDFIRERDVAHSSLAYMGQSQGALSGPGSAAISDPEAGGSP